MPNRVEIVRKWERVFCKLCKRVTEHMDFREWTVGFKCTECGEYNKPEVNQNV